MVPTHHCPQFWRSKTNSNSIQFIELYSGVSEQIKSLQPIGPAAEFKFESKLEPLPVYSRRQMKVLTAKSMAELLGQGSSKAGMRFRSSELAAIAAGSYRLVEGKCATTLAILTPSQFKSQKGFNALWISGHKEFFF